MTEAPVYDCVEIDEIVAIASGEVEVERLEELLDHVDECEDCADRLAVIVVLRAHREEAVELLRRAREWKEGNRRG